MAYAHYWRRAPDLTLAHFTWAAEQVRQVVNAVEAQGIKLAGPTGAGLPEITNNCIAFNGLKKCGHPYRDLGSPWPSPTAAGVMATDKPVVGPWFSGALLDTRICNGDCSGSPFIVDRQFLVREWDRIEDGKYFSHCETHYKPYDLAVTAALVRLKETLGDEILVSSDGKDRAFDDAKRLGRTIFGWTERFELENDAPSVVEP